MLKLKNIHTRAPPTYIVLFGLLGGGVGGGMVMMCRIHAGFFLQLTSHAFK